MSEIYRRVLDLISNGEILISAHGYDELSDDIISLEEVISGVNEAIVVENYPDYIKGPSVLVLQRDAKGDPIHVVWGIPAGQNTPSVLVTAYRPDPDRCEQNVKRRRK